MLFNKIVAKLERLDEYVGYLQSLQKVNKKSFLADYHFYGLAERYFQLSIEVLLDIGKMIILARSFRKPASNDDVFTVLREAKILRSRLAARMEGIAGFRNILVHDYEKIDRGIVYDALKHSLGDMTDFKKAISKFLDSRFDR